MYIFDSGAKALVEQIRRKALPPPSMPRPEHRKRATILTAERNADLIAGAERKTQAALSLQDETARKEEAEFERRFEYIREQQEAQKRKAIMRGLKL